MTRPIDLTHAIVLDELERARGQLPDGIAVVRSYNLGGVEVNYERTWSDDRTGIPIFNNEDRVAGSQLLGACMARMGVLPGQAEDANVIVTPGLGTSARDGSLLEAPMRTRRAGAAVRHGPAPPMGAEGAGIREARMTDPFERHGLRRVINASGTETPYGGSPVRPEVIAAVNAIVPHSVFMAELQSAACGVIARAFDCEAGCVTGCTAASISIAIAACMTGRDLARAERLPDAAGMKSKVVMQKGHEVTYGQNVSQNVRLVGARVVEIGAATQCGAYQLEAALGEDVAAALYVVSHLTPQHRLIDLETFCTVCCARGVPVVVDAASQPDPRPYLKAGADLVLFSAQKAFSGITAGVIAGRRALVQACIYQEHGIGRPMKAGKEAVAGTIAAIEAWLADDATALRAGLEARLAATAERLRQIKGIAVRRHGRQQLELVVDANVAGITAVELARVLAAEDPAVLLWHHYAPDGVLLLNLGKVSEAMAGYVCARIAAYCEGDCTEASSHPTNLADAIAEHIARWPLPLRGKEGGAA